MNVNKGPVRFGVFMSLGAGFVPVDSDPAVCFAHVTAGAAEGAAHATDSECDHISTSKTVPLYAACGVDEVDVDRALRSRPMHTWFARATSMFEIEHLTITGVDHRNPDHRTPEGVLFVHVRVQYKGLPFVKVVDLANDSAVILVVLCCEGTAFTVLVRQDRDAVGEKGFLEVPAGRVEEGSVKSVALKEIEEELGLVVSPDELRLLTKLGEEVATSPGSSSEMQTFFCVVREVSAAELDAMRGKQTGLEEEGESLTCEVIEFAALPHVARRDAKSLVAWTLYQQSRKG